MALAMAAGRLVAQVPAPDPDALESTQEERDGLMSRLPAPPREVRRAFSQAQAAIQGGRFTDALDALDGILSDVSQGDFFLPPSPGSPRLVSLRGEAQRIIGEMSPAGREAYELQAGVDATRLLQQAIRDGDLEGLGEVGRRYFHTRAGYQASYLLARAALDRQQPTSAIMRLQELRQATSFAKDREPELSALLAAAWSMGGKPEQAQAVLRDAATRFPGVGVRIGGKQQTLPAADAPVSELTAWLEPFSTLAMAGGSSTPVWVTGDGDASRDRRTRGGMPLPRLEWSVGLPFQSDAAKIAALARGLSERDAPAIPRAQPFAVADWVVMPTPRMLMGMRLNGGSRGWFYPSNAFQEFDRPSLDSNTGRPKRQDPTLESQLRQRIWDDQPFSHMSTDGRSIYCLRELPRLAIRDAANILMFNQGPGGEQLLPKIQNRLVAVDVVGEGRTRWLLGKSDGEEARLAEAFFLGAPLPLRDVLYAIVEIKDELRLVALRSDNGRMLWSQQLLQLESPLSLPFDPTRRMTAIAPSYRDGVLVCPTAAGAVIAVDPISRSLLWAYRYERNGGTANFNPQGNFSLPSPLPPPGERWVDGTAMLVEGVALVTPVESDALHCLDLLTGEPRWPPIPRDEGLYLAGVHRGVVAVVGRHVVRGYRLEDGEEAWPPILIPNEATPSGKGFHSGASIFVPTTAAELLRIDLVKGVVAERMSTEHVLGNLCCLGSYLISQGPAELRVYMLRESLREELTRQVAASNDPSVLQDYANLLVGDGETGEALKVLRRAISLTQDPVAKSRGERLLFRTIMDLSQDQSADYESLIEEARGLARDYEDQREVLERIADIRTRDGNIPEAIDLYLELAELPRTSTEGRAPSADSLLRRIDGARRMDADTWLGFQLQRLEAAAGPADKEALAARVRSALDSALAASGTAGLERFLHTFTGNPLRVEALREVARRWRSTSNVSRATLCFAELCQSSDTAVALEAKSLAAELLAAEFPATALRLWESIPASESMGPVRDEKIRGLRSNFPVWPAGKVIAEESVGEGEENPRNPRMEPIELLDGQGLFPQGYTLHLHRDDRPRDLNVDHSELVVIPPTGSVDAQIAIPIPGKRGDIPPTQMFRAQACGPLLTVALGPQLLAIDLAAARQPGADPLLWQWRGTPPADPDSDMFEERGRYQFAPIENPFAGNVDHARRYIPSQTSAVMPGPIGPAGVSFLHEGTLHCLDGVTGKVRWQRQRIGEPTEIFGDCDRIYTSTDRGKTATVFSFHDGEELPARKIPPCNQHWARRGSKILAWNTRNNLFFRNRLELFLWDAQAEKRVWEITDFELGSKGCLVEQDEVAIIRPKGDLVVVDLLTGEIRLRAELTLSAPPISLQVIRNKDQYLVLVGTDQSLDDARLNRQNIRIQGYQIGGQAAKFSGLVMAYDRTDGKPLWDHPVVAQQQFLAGPIPSESPILAFFRTIQFDSPPRRGEPAFNAPNVDLRTELACLDRRDGSLIFTSNAIPPQFQALRIVADPVARTCDLFCSNNYGVKLTFTEEPTETRPPATLPDVRAELKSRRPELESPAATPVDAPAGDVARPPPAVEETESAEMDEDDLNVDDE